MWGFFRIIPRKPISLFWAIFLVITWLSCLGNQALFGFLDESEAISPNPLSVLQLGPAIFNPSHTPKPSWRLDSVDALESVKIDVLDQSDQLVHAGLFKLSAATVGWPSQWTLPDGEYQVVLTGTDFSKKKTESVIVFVTIDTTPPKWEIPKALFVSDENPVTLSISIDETSATVSVQLQIQTASGNNEVAFVGEADPEEPILLPLASVDLLKKTTSLRYQITFSDSAQNQSTGVGTLTVDHLPPVIEWSISKEFISTSSYVPIDAKIYDPDSKKLEKIWVTLADEDQPDPILDIPLPTNNARIKTWLDTSSIPDGPHKLTLSALDSVGHLSYKEIILSLHRQPPQILSQTISPHYLFIDTPSPTLSFQFESATETPLRAILTNETGTLLWQSIPPNALSGSIALPLPKKNTVVTLPFLFTFYDRYQNSSVLEHTVKLIRSLPVPKTALSASKFKQGDSADVKFYFGDLTSYDFSSLKASVSLVHYPLDPLPSETLLWEGPITSSEIENDFEIPQNLVPGSYTLLWTVWVDGVLKLDHVASLPIMGDTPVPFVIE